MAVVNFRGYFHDLVGRLRGSFIESRREDSRREAEIINSSGTLYFYLNFIYASLAQEDLCILNHFKCILYRQPTAH